MKIKRRKLLSLVLVFALVFANFSGMEVKAEGTEGHTHNWKYSIKENNAEVLKALLEKVIDSTDEDKQLSSVTFIEHQKIFQELGFSVEKEWKRYVKMNKEK